MTSRDLKPGERAIITSGKPAVYDIGQIAETLGVGVADVMAALEAARVTSRGMSLAKWARARDAELARKGASAVA